MPNGTWKRTTTEERRASRKIRYAHVSVLVGVKKDELTGMLVYTRTPRGEGSTATRKEPRRTKRGALRVAQPKKHDWAGAYPGRLASIEAMRRARRNAKKHSREGARRQYFAAQADAYFLGHESVFGEATCLTQSAIAA